MIYNGEITFIYLFLLIILEIEILIQNRLPANRN